MRGSLVHLDRIRDDDDLERLSTLSAGPASLYSSGRPIFLDTAQLRQMLREHQTDVLAVRTVTDDMLVGMVTWRQQTYPGSYTMGVAVGDPQRWGAGMGMEAVILLLTYLFHDLNAHRLHVEVAAYNSGMLPVLTSGLVRIEGVLRDYFFVDGEYHDCVVGSILRDEFYRISEEFGGIVDSVAPEEKARGRRMIDELLTSRGLPGLVRDHADRDLPTAGGAEHGAVR